MKLLKDLLQKVSIKEIKGIITKKVKKLCINHLNVVDNSIFAAICGNKFDGHNFIINAIKKGANTIICEKFPNEINKNITYILVNNTSEAIGIISSNFFDNPSEKINIIGITGTDGKTTIASMLYELFKKLGEKVALISTINIKIINYKFLTKNTTPDVITINHILYLAIKKGCKYAFIEVSSHGIFQKRIFGLNFKLGIFTNITHDHINYHKNFNNYFLIKKLFFDSLSKKSFALINADDKYSSIILKNSNANKYSYALKNNKSTYKAKIIKKNFSYTELLLNNNFLKTKLIGEYNTYNLLAIYGTANLLLKINEDKIIKIMSTLRPIKGRFEQFLYKKIRIIIDYAHTPNAISNVLETIQELKNNNNKLICVIGCGGNRDIEKRPIMASIAYNKSDLVILTSDNPREENPQNIINDMMKNLKIKNFKKKLFSIIDRKKAIENAIFFSKKGDIILIAGKGHEKYQEINGKRYYFNEKKLSKKFLKKIKK
ncbi:MAG: UDP-N-acetylmuramoyl-L-alanyl-D-glutamate--2,6-diaminopimelate ligase [Candidatus Bostrichicola ureolyticus]|nr:MAG: UDP-N-acetylmuramoyl-L-alanyl-D-glutamate--2,6-diaminopimelate ligase [Candidatus Bostrichicola ureolyticus]